MWRSMRMTRDRKRIIVAHCVIALWRHYYYALAKFYCRGRVEGHFSGYPSHKTYTCQENIGKAISRLDDREIAVSFSAKALEFSLLQNPQTCSDTHQFFFLKITGVSFQANKATRWWSFQIQLHPALKFTSTPCASWRHGDALCFYKLCLFGSGYAAKWTSRLETFSVTETLLW